MKKITKLLFSVTSSLLIAGSTLTATSCGGETVSGLRDGMASPVVYNGEKVTISFYHCMGSALRDILTTGIADFNKIYPNIKVEQKSFGDYDGVLDQITTELSTGLAPSLAYCYPDHVAMYNKAEATLPLDGWIANTDKVADTGETFGLTNPGDYVPFYYEEGQIYDDAKTMYTLPMLKSTELLYYNVEYFTENELDVPTTWAEMEATCKKILQIESAKEGGLEANPCIPLGYDSGANWFITMTEQYKSGYTTSEKGNYFVFNNEKNREFVEYFRNWYKAGYVTTEEIFKSYTSDLFTQVDPTKVKCYMCIGSSAGATYQCPDPLQDKSYPFTVGIAPIPQADKENVKMISQGPSICLFNKQNDQEIAAAWLFAKFLTTNHEFQARCSMNNGYTPVIQSIKTNETYAKFLAKADGNKNLQATSVLKTMELSTMKNTDGSSYLFVSPAFAGSSAARKDMAVLMKDCFRNEPEGGKTVAQLIEDIFTKSQTTLQKKYDR